MTKNQRNQPPRGQKTKVKGKRRYNAPIRHFSLTDEQRAKLFEDSVIGSMFGLVGLAVVESVPGAREGVRKILWGTEPTTDDVLANALENGPVDHTELQEEGEHEE